jgi:hypothetical protein
LMWLRIRRDGGLLQMLEWIFWFHAMRGIACLSEDLLFTRYELCSVKLVRQHLTNEFTAFSLTLCLKLT